MEEGIYLEVENRETLVLTQALRPATVSKNVLDRHVQLTFEYCRSVRAYDEYEIRYGRECLEMERRCWSIVAEHLKEYDDKRAVEREWMVWSWHQLYHMCAVNPRLQLRLAPMCHCPGIIPQRRIRLAVCYPKRGHLP